MFDLQLIHCFLVVEKERSFSRAGTRLGIAQSAVSLRIRRLEDLLGFAVFHRTSRRVRLSNQGADFLPHAQALIAAQQSAREAARAIAGSSRRSVVIGSYQLLARARARLISNYIAKHPEDEISVVYGNRDDLIDRLRRHQLDMAVVLSHPGLGEAGLECRPLGKLFCHIVLPPDDPLGDRMEIELKELRGRTISTLPSWPDRKVINYLIDRLKDAGIIPIESEEADKDASDAYARVRKLSHLAWFAHRRAPHNRGSWTVIPLAASMLSIDLVVLSSTSTPPDFVDRLTGAMSGLEARA